MRLLPKRGFFNRFKAIKIPFLPKNSSFIFFTGLMWFHALDFSVKITQCWIKLFILVFINGKLNSKIVWQFWEHTYWVTSRQQNVKSNLNFHIKQGNHSKENDVNTF